MKHAKHSKPLRVARIALALLVALAASTAAGQAGKPPADQQKATPVPTGPSYGPVLHPQPVKSEPGAQLEQTPQAQEEKAGAAPAAGRAPDPDPSARPAPQPQDPAKSQQRKDGKKTDKRSARRSAPVRVDPVAVAMLPAAPRPSLPARPPTLDPGPVQINSCLGGTCTDTNGATYNTGVGNAAVSSGGRLCTRSGNSMQCF